VVEVDLRGMGLKTLYWHVRNIRPYQTALRRKLYRYIEQERKRLHEAGVDPELTRLYCRHLSNLRNRAAAERFEFYNRQQTRANEKLSSLTFA
jgi:hypothetical protein